MPNNLPEFISQSALQAYITCPRLYQLQYVQKLAWPAEKFDPQSQTEQIIRDGEFFHRLAHRSFLGIEPQLLDEMAFAYPNPNMATWWQNFKSSKATGLVPIGTTEQVLPEKIIAAQIEGYTLVAKVDLLATTPQAIQIFDWKTSQKLPRPGEMSGKVQTLVYLLVISNAAHLPGRPPITRPPVSMTYWYAAHPTQPITVLADENQLEDSRRKVLALLGQIEQESEFAATTDARVCAGCQYRSHCGRGAKALAMDDYDWEEEFMIDQQPEEWLSASF